MFEIIKIGGLQSCSTFQIKLLLPMCKMCSIILVHNTTPKTLNSTTISTLSCLFGKCVHGNDHRGTNLSLCARWFMVWAGKSPAKIGPYAFGGKICCVCPTSCSSTSSQPLFFTFGSGRQREWKKSPVLPSRNDSKE